MLQSSSLLIFSPDLAFSNFFICYYMQLNRSYMSLAWFQEGYAVSRSHIFPNAIKTNCPMASCIQIARELRQAKSSEQIAVPSSWRGSCYQKKVWLTKKILRCSKQILATDGGWAVKEDSWKLPCTITHDCCCALVVPSEPAEELESERSICWHLCLLISSST